MTAPNPALRAVTSALIARWAIVRLQAEEVSIRESIGSALDRERNIARRAVVAAWEAVQRAIDAECEAARGAASSSEPAAIRDDDCLECGGSGEVPNDDELNRRFCPRCHGTGRRPPISI